MRTLASMLLVAVCVLCAALPSWALPLSITAGAPGSGTGTAFSIGGTLVADTGVQTYTTLDVSGTYESQVYSDPGNVFCNGCLDFIYAVSNTGTDAVQALSVSFFTGFLTNVGFANNLVVGGGFTNIVATSIGSNFGVINFQFAPGVPNGDSTQVLVVETNAQTWDAGSLSIQNAYNTTVPTFQPAVPEPASLLLLGTVLAFVGHSLRKRFTV